VGQKVWPLRLTAQILTPEPICATFGTRQRRCALKISANSVFINFVAQSDDIGGRLQTGFCSLPVYEIKKRNSLLTYFSVGSLQLSHDDVACCNFLEI